MNRDSPEKTYTHTQMQPHTPIGALHTPVSFSTFCSWAEDGGMQAFFFLFAYKETQKILVSVRKKDARSGSHTHTNTAMVECERLWLHVFNIIPSLFGCYVEGNFWTSPFLHFQLPSLFCVHWQETPMNFVDPKEYNYPGLVRKNRYKTILPSK